MPSPKRFSDQNWVTSGWYAPSRVEAELFDLEVIQGAIPEGIEGTLYRCGPDPQFPAMNGEDSYFNGEGMVHMFRFAGGRVDYRCRYVRTERFLAQQAARRSLFGVYRNRFTNDPLAADVHPGTANTHIVWHAGRLFVLKEDDLPYEIDSDTLETIGKWDYGGAIGARGLSAHPKIDMVTNEMVTFGFQARGDGTTDIAYYVIDADGRVAHETWFQAPYPGAVHDFAATENHVIFPFYPLITDMEVLKAGGPFYQWHRDEQSVFAILPRRGTADQIRWFRGPACFGAHVMNAFEHGNQLILDVDLSKTGWHTFPNHDGVPHEPGSASPMLTRLTFDLHSNEDSYRTERLVGSVACGMSRSDDRYQGRPYRHGYSICGPADQATIGRRQGIGHFDHVTGDLTIWNPGAASAVHEPTVVPRAEDAAEGDGYVMVCVNRQDTNRSDLVILDATDFAAGPVATIKLPIRVRSTFHGMWVPADVLAQGRYHARVVAATN